jgi:hypothetical protein
MHQVSRELISKCYLYDPSLRVYLTFPIYYDHDDRYSAQRKHGMMRVSFEFCCLYYIWLNFDAFKALSRKEALLILTAKSLHSTLIGRSL